jgi:hypothetical protein
MGESEAGIMKRRLDHSRAEMLRRLRVGNLRKLSRHRYGPTLPDDDAGREDLRELLLPISLSANADIKMPNAIEVWAPWMQLQEAIALIDDINRTPCRQRMPTAKLLGRRLGVTNAERERLKLWTIAACDMTREEAREWRKAKNRENKRRLRQLRGAKLQAASFSRQKPWLALGLSRASWYRQRETTSSAVRLLYTEDKPVSPQQALPPKKLPAMLPTPTQSKTPIKAEKPKRQRHAADAATAREIKGRSCLTEPKPMNPEPSEPTEPEPTAADGDDMTDTMQEQYLAEMITVLRRFLGNRATSSQWYKQMQIYGGSGWSKPSFKRRLKLLKHRGWIRIVGQADADLERTPMGSLFETTEIAPGAPQQPGSDAVPESAAMAMSGAADAAARAAMELLQRLNRGKPAA